MELKMARSDYIGIFVVISRSKGKFNIIHCNVHTSVHKNAL